MNLKSLVLSSLLLLNPIEKTINQEQIQNTICVDKELNYTKFFEKNDEYIDLVTSLYAKGALLSRLNDEEFLENTYFELTNLSKGNWNSVIHLDVMNHNNTWLSGLGLFYLTQKNKTPNLPSLTSNEYEEILKKYAPSTTQLLDSVQLIQTSLPGDGSAVFYPNLMTIFYDPENKYFDLNNILHELGHVKDENVHENNYANNDLGHRLVEFKCELNKKLILNEIKKNNTELYNNIRNAPTMIRSIPRNDAWGVAFFHAQNLNLCEGIKVLEGFQNNDEAIKNKYMDKLSNEINLRQQPLNMEQLIIKKYDDLIQSTPGISLIDLRENFLELAQTYVNKHTNIK